MNTNFPSQSTLDGVAVSVFCCDIASPDGRDVRDVMTDRMIYHRHMGGFLVFSVFGAGLNLQNLRFFPTNFVAFIVCMLG
jgi:hypothetical protein